MGVVEQQGSRNAIISYLGVGLGFLNLVVLYPRILSDDEMGLTRLLISLALLGAQIAQFGSDNALLRFFPYFRGARSNQAGLVRYVGLIAGAGLMVVLGGFFLLRADAYQRFSDSSSLFSEYYWLLFPLLVSEAFFILFRAYARSVRYSVAPVFIRDFLLRLLQTLLIVFFWLLDFSFHTFMLVYVAVYILCTIVLLFSIIRNGLQPSGGATMPRPTIRRQMLVYGGFSVISGLASMAMGNVDQVMIGLLLSDSLPFIAYYAVGFYVAALILIPGRSIGQIAFPLIADAWKRRDTETISDIYKRSALSQLVVGAMLFVMIWSCLDGMLTFLPPAYAAGKYVILIVGAAQLISTSIGMNGGILLMSKNYRFDAYLSLFLLVSNVGLNYWLITLKGIEGAAWATFISIVLVNIVRVLYLKWKFGLWPFSIITLKALGFFLFVAFLIHKVPAIEIAIVDMLMRGLLVGAASLIAVRYMGVAPDLKNMLDKGLAGLGLRW
jgi:O-antigen/teichoic acid export membrane protein